MSDQPSMEDLRSRRYFEFSNNIISAVSSEDEGDSLRYARKSCEWLTDGEISILAAAFLQRLQADQAMALAYAAILGEGNRPPASVLGPFVNTITQTANQWVKHLSEVERSVYATALIKELRPEARVFAVKQLGGHFG